MRGASASDRGRMVRLLRRSRRIVLTTHVGPDGDGFGSQLALARALRTLDRDVRIINQDLPPDNLEFLVSSGDNVRSFDEGDVEWIRRADAVVLVDVNGVDRLGSVSEAVRRTEGVLACIDHHPLPEGEPDPFGVSWNRPDAAAAGICVHELLAPLGVRLTREIAEPLYAAILTDTGSFRFSKTTFETHRVAAELLRCGVDPSRVYEEIYERTTASRVRLWGDILSTLELHAGGRIAVLSLTQEMLERCGATLEDSSEVINQAISIRGVEFTVLFKELAPDRTKASLRSRGDVDVNEFARRWDGGGHMHAAGIVLPWPLAEARRVLLEAAIESFRGRDAARETRDLPAPAKSSSPPIRRVK